MFKIAALVYVIAAPTLMGILATAVMATPSLMEEGGKWISIAAAIGALLSVPISYFIAKAINEKVMK